MEMWRTVQRLRGLLRSESDCAAICQKTLDGITAPAWKGLVGSLARDHAQQIVDLRTILEQLGAASDSPNAPILREALSALGGDMSDKTRLGMCLQWEEHAAHAYEQALAEHHPRTVQALLHGHRAVAADHVAALQAVLSTEQPVIRTA